MRDVPAFSCILLHASPCSFVLFSQQNPPNRSRQNVGCPLKIIYAPPTDDPSQELSGMNYCGIFVLVCTFLELLESLGLHLEPLLD